MLSLRAGGFTFSDGLLAASLGLLIVAVAGRRFEKPDGVIQFALILGLIGVFASEWRDPHALEGVAIVARLIFVWALWQWQAKQVLLSDRHLAATIQAFILGCAVSGIAAVAQYRYGFVIPGSELTSGLRAPGLAQHVNDQGGALAVAFAMAVAFLAIDKTKRRIVYLVAAVGAAVGLMLSGSVTGMLSAIAAAVLVILRQRFSVRSTVIALIAAFGSYKVGSYFMAQTAEGEGADPITRFLMATGQQGTAEQNTLSSRLDTMRKGWDWIGENPFIGRGFSSAQSIAVHGTPVHNILLGYWAAGGLLVVVAVTVLVGRGVYVAFKRIAPSIYREQIIAGMFATVTFSMTAPIIYQRYFWFPFMLAFAAAAITRRRAEENAEAEQPEPVPARS